MNATNARKYAQAFMNLFGTSLNQKDIDAFAVTRKSLKKQHSLLATFSLIQAQNQKAVEQLIASITNKAYKRLIQVLIARHQLTLLPLVLFYIEQLYLKAHTIKRFVITSFPKISTEDLQTIQLFLARSTQSDIIYEYAVDPALIAGIRAQSDGLLWEHSIQQQIRRMRQTLIR